MADYVWPQWKESVCKNDPAFMAVIDKTLKHEGGFVDDKSDPGGATNWGISLRFLKGLNPKVTKYTIMKLTLDQAMEIYYVHFWKKFKMDAFPLSIAAKLFDITVNAGNVQAVKILQRALRAVTLEHIVNDGIAGPVTFQILKKCDESALLAAFRSEHAAFYRELVASKPAFAKFKDGWLARAYS